MSELSSAEVDRLDKAGYFSLGTYRKTGAVVRTPVWFAGTEGLYYVFSAGNAGKVKRLRASDQAQIAICDVRGKVLGPWCDGRARLLTGEAEIEQALVTLRAKYGWQMWLADVGSSFTGKFKARAYIKVEI